MKDRGAKTADAASTAKSAVERLPHYEKPPVSEVACGVTFEPLKQFLVAHVGLYWARIRDTYPECEHAVPLATPDAPGGWMDGTTGLPLPRQWFISADKQGLIQLQGNCFYFNWRRFGDNDVYPRFSSVIATFKKQLEMFQTFLNENELTAPAITGCELTYVNHIPQADGWESVADLSKVFRDFCWNERKGRFLPPPSNLAWKTQFPLPGEGILTASIAQAMRVRDQMPTLKFELSARVKLKDKSSDQVWEWFETAHRWIVLGFADLTQGEIQDDVWRKVNG